MNYCAWSHILVFWMIAPQDRLHTAVRGPVNRGRGRSSCQGVACVEGCKLTAGLRYFQVGGIGGPVGQLLDQNQRILLQFKDNMRLYKVHARQCAGRSVVTLLAMFWIFTNLHQHHTHTSPTALCMLACLADHAGGSALLQVLSGCQGCVLKGWPGTVRHSGFTASGCWLLPSQY